MNKKPTRGMSREELQRALAGLLLTVAPSSRLPTVRTLSKSLGVSVGSVQTAFSRLEASNAVSVERFGRTGTYLRDRSVGQLWHIAEGAPMVIGLPLPTSRRIEGLATAIRFELDSREIEAFSMFMRGSRKRIAALHQRRCHVAVMSLFTARQLCDHRVRIVLEMPDETFVSEHVVLENASLPKDKSLRVAVDPTSFDQQRITEMEFANQETEFVTTPYTQLAKAVQSGRCDCAVWSLDEMAGQNLEGISVRRLGKHVVRALQGEDLRAAFVVRSNDHVTSSCLNDLAIVDLQSIQTKVMSNQIVPEY